MYIEIGIPAILPLTLLKIRKNGSESIGLLGATLQHPPIQIRAQAASQLSITGPRADVASAYAQQLLETMQPTTSVEVQIEHAIPAFMGLGSESMLSLGILHALNHINGRDAISISEAAQLLKMETTAALPLWGYHHGGLLLLDLADHSAAPLRRAEPDTSEKNAWGFVLVLPRVNAGVAENMELNRQSDLLAGGLSIGRGVDEAYVDTLWNAVEMDDLSAFGQALTALQTQNQAAFGRSARLPMTDEKAPAVLQIMQEQGAVAWGQSLTGYALYALTRGARATINLRKALRPLVTHKYGQMLATVMDHQGFRLVEREGTLGTAA